ncbi:GAF domain-containing protein [Terribacillus saccharophilus]|nr:GAF domain-containing protein [Terribacillus goriensis]MEC0281062.1 GAF domain-containing protein [Terribacillus saccharophilus]MEC0289262.1 GAF domain-containing protein [Terribacillus saccharophilus]
MKTFAEMTKSVSAFDNFDEAAQGVLNIISEFVKINTLFIAKNDTVHNQIIKVVNQKEKLLQEGEKLPFNETLCKLSVDHGREILIIPDLANSELSQSLDVAKNLAGGSFIGIPIYFENGENYGTICGLDSKSFPFTEEHVRLFETMASLLTFVLELDNANKQIQNLSAPFVPITSGVAVLPIIGFINEDRSEKIIQLSLQKSQELNLDYLVIDLSGISQIDHVVSNSLLKIANLLKLIGVEPILTGFHPDLALKALSLQMELKDITIEANLERALNKIGLNLEKRDRL